MAKKTITRKATGQIHSGSILFGMLLGGGLIIFAQEYQKTLAATRARTASASPIRTYPGRPMPRPLPRPLSATAPNVSCPWAQPLVIG
jgi:hypothetical protein